LNCAHHANLALYGDDTLDALACAFGLSTATVTGVMRIVSDRHYATDVMVGAIIGLGVGYGLPAGVYYRAGDSNDRASDVFRVTVVPQPRGLAFVGAF
jgi:membrane-associated phospholipid phosphatase